MEKSFYTETGSLKSFDIIGLIDKGCQGEVYMLSDGRCLKIFNWQFSSEYVETFKMIMEMDLDNFYKIYEMLYDEDGNFKAYVMEYYEKSFVIDILTMPTDYTINNFCGISDSVNKLTDASILAGDLKSRNVIVNRSGIIVIDANLYLHNSYIRGRMLAEKNRENVYKLFADLYYEAMIKYHISGSLQFDRKIIESLFSSHESQEEVCKKLKRYKYPIDYVMYNRKK